VSLRSWLRRVAEDAYRTALSNFDAALRSGALLGGDVLARWDDAVASGDLDDALRSRKQRKGRRARRGQAPSRIKGLDVAARAALAAEVTDVADRAAELVAQRWNENPAGAALLSYAARSREEDTRVEKVFADAFGDGSEAVSDVPLDRSSPDLDERAARAISGWQDQLIRLVQGKRYDDEPLGLVLTVAVLGERENDKPRALLGSVFGGAETAELITRARADLLERVRLLLDEELLRFVAILGSAGQVDEIAAVRLYQAEYSLEAAR
jgi:hypothetical protein